MMMMMISNNIAHLDGVAEECWIGYV